MGCSTWGRCMGRVRNLLNQIFRAKYINLGGGIRVPRSAVTSNLDHSLSAVWAAVTLLAGHMSSIPLGLFERLPDGSRRRVANSPIDQALRYEASPNVAACQMREALVANIELHDIGYVSAIAVDGQLRLRTFDSNHVQPDAGEREYHVTVPGKPRVDVPAEYMIEFPALTFDMKNPVKAKSLRRRSMNLAVSYEERAQAYNQNSSSPSGVVTWGAGYGKLEEPARQRLEKKFEDLYQDISKAGGVAFMPEGSSFSTVSFNPEQLQMLAARQFSVQEVARWWGVPPNKIGDLSHATFSNIEHLAIEYVQDSLLRRAVKIEQILTLALIPRELRDRFFIEHNLDGLLRGDFKTRMDGYAVAKNWGLRSTNDIAKLENWNPVSKEDGGETYYMPLNMMPTRQLEAVFAGERGIVGIRARAAEITDRKVRALTTARRQITEQFRPVFGTTSQTLVDQETEDIRAAAAELLAENKIEEFRSFVTEYYVAFADEIRNGFAGLLTAMESEISPLALEEIGSEESFDLSEFLATYAQTLGRRWAGSSRGQLHEVVNEAVEASEDPQKAVEARLDEWEEKKAGKVEQREPPRVESAVSKAVWARAGVRRIRWVTFGDSCDYCVALDGAIIAIEASFVGAGVPFQPAGAEPFVSTSNIGHPPLHDGCNCGIAADL